ncbi:MAG: hypothetical protein V1490_02125 [Candidatus Omnitrophota bacterium]
MRNIWWIVVLLAVLIAAGIAGAQESQAAISPGANRPEIIKGIDISRLITAIYWAEGGPNTRHPYGILVKYKDTSPKQACRNTILHRLRDWDGKGDFISYLGRFYCPVGAANDPRGLNVNWIRNVQKLYNRRI